MKHVSLIKLLGSCLATKIFAAQILATQALAANVAGVVEHSDPSKVSQPGGTGTTIVVDIESPTGTTRTSHNTYTRFNVPGHGVELNNSTANARTIINEVTGSGTAFRTTIEGPLTVTGTRAHVVVANPNGITVNGGSFVNTSTALLTTGDILGSATATSVTGANAQLGSDPFSTYYIIKAEQGDILVQSGGLSGTFARLDMIAKEIDVTGPVSLGETPIALNAGVTTTVLKHASAIPTPGADQSGTIYYTPITGACDTSTPNTAACGSNATVSDSSVLVDISGAAANLSGGTVNVLINDDGAGFRFAGSEMTAEAGQMVITARGTLEFGAANGGNVTAETDLTLTSTGRDITFDGNTGVQTRLTAGEDLVIDADTTGDVINNGYVLQSQVPADATKTLTGSVTVTADDVINNSLGSDALAIIYSSSGKMTSGSYRETGTGGSAVLSDRDHGGVTITANGSIINNSGRISSNNGITLSMGGDLYNRVLRASGANEPVVRATETKQGFLFLRRMKSSRSYDYGSLTIPGSTAYIKAARGDIQLDFTGTSAGNLYNIGGEISADGGMNYRLASATIDNAGNDTATAGAAGDTITLTNATTGQSFTYTVTGSEGTIGNELNGGQELLLAFVDAVNSYKASSGAFSDLLELDVLETNSGANTDDKYGFVIGSEDAANYSISYSSSGSDTIAMTGTYTDGSIFIGQPSDSSLTAKNVAAIHNQAVLTGITKRDSGCFLGICRQNGFSDMTSTGGLISAQNRIEMQLDGGTLNASYDPADLSVAGNLTGSRNLVAAPVLPANGYITNDGGRIAALNNNENNSTNALSIDATSNQVHIVSRALTHQLLVKRNQGVLNSGFARIRRMDQGGSFTANMGRLNFSDLGEIRLVGGTLSGGSDGTDIYSGGSKVSQDALDPDRTLPVSANNKFDGTIGITNGFLNIF